MYKSVSRKKEKERECVYVMYMSIILYHTECALTADGRLMLSCSQSDETERLEQAMVYYQNEVTHRFARLICRVSLIL